MYRKVVQIKVVNLNDTRGVAWVNFYCDASFWGNFLSSI